MTKFITKQRNSSHIALNWSQKITKWFNGGIFATFENEYINT